MRCRKRGRMRGLERFSPTRKGARGPLSKAKRATPVRRRQPMPVLRVGTAASYSEPSPTPPSQLLLDRSVLLERATRFTHTFPRYEKKKSPVPYLRRLVRSVQSLTGIAGAHFAMPFL